MLPDVLRCPAAEVRCDVRPLKYPAAAAVSPAIAANIRAAALT